MANQVELRNGKKIAVEDLPDKREMPIGKTYIGDPGTVGAPVSQSNPMPVTASSSGAARTTINATTTDQTVIRANAARRGLFFFNDSDSPLFIGLGTAAVSSSDFTMELPAHTGWNVPFNFLGEVHVVWASATGSVHVTELS